jgi:DNA-directed RNA polymerase subunit RPC12/RpoP
VATKESIRTTGVPSGPIARLLPPLLLEAILLGAAVLWYVPRRKSRSVEEDQLYTECSRCRQRLRYHAAKIGHLAQCPRCKHRFIFPVLAPDEEEMRLRWWQPQWWRSRLKV